MTDQFKFLEGVSNWCNHRPLLLLGLHLTQGRVSEYGSGDGSTPYLRKYCEANNRIFFSYDNNMEWTEKCGSTFIPDWERADIWHTCGLAFIDHAPGEDRHLAVKRMMNKADIIICHDSERGGAGDYKFELVFPHFKYHLHYNLYGGGAGASMVSNKIDITKYCGTDFHGFKFDDFKYYPK